MDPFCWKGKLMQRVAALFDMDKTLLDVSSGQLYVRYLYRHGQIGLCWPNIVIRSRKVTRPVVLW
jgi:hypothetical protein